MEKNNPAHSYADSWDLALKCKDNECWLELGKAAMNQLDTKMAMNACMHHFPVLSHAFTHSSTSGRRCNGDGLAKDPTNRREKPIGRSYGVTVQRLHYGRGTRKNHPLI